MRQCLFTASPFFTLVAITETAFQEALGVQWRIGTTLLPQANRLPPLTAKSFRLRPSPA
jgi:hypothetical protein